MSWLGKLERQDNGHIKGAKFKAVWAMADQAEKTAKQSYGQTVERTDKNKVLRLSKDALIEHLNNLLHSTKAQTFLSPEEIQIFLGSRKQS